MITKVPKKLNLQYFLSDKCDDGKLSGNYGNHTKQPMRNLTTANRAAVYSESTEWTQAARD